MAIPAGAAGTFQDDDGNLHESSIETIASAGITKGCNPPKNDLYCPNREVTRGEMAAFLVRLFELPASGRDYFSDDDDSTFEAAINALAKAGLTTGCNPPASDRFCPGRGVTRGQMAAFLQRALDLQITGTDYFGDDSDSPFEGSINAIARVGITTGCNPPASDRFCPVRQVQRDEMASFLARALQIHRNGTPSTTRPPQTTTTTRPASTGAFLERNGIVAMEVESVPVATGWSRQTATSGYTGPAYYYRTAANTTQTGQGILTYRIVISEPGTYAVSIRSRRDRSAGENVENGQRNDVFVKMDSDQWWKATTHASFGTWGWIDKKTITHATFQPLTWNLGAGTHTLLISGRSQYIKIDRIHVFEVPQGSDLAAVRSRNPAASTPESPRQ